MSANRFRNGHLRDFAAARTGAAMPLIFGDDGGELGQLGHLMPRRRRIERPRFLRQGRLAMTARRRHVLHEFVDALRRQQHLQMRRMPRLTARFLASWLLGRPLGQRRCRPWRRRRLGQVVQPRLQLGHLGFQDGQASIPLTTTWTFGLIHAARLLTAPPSRCASFYLNGHTTGERLSFFFGLFNVLRLLMLRLPLSPLRGHFLKTPR